MSCVKNPRDSFYVAERKLVIAIFRTTGSKDYAILRKRLGETSVIIA